VVGFYKVVNKNYVFIPPYYSYLLQKTYFLLFLNKNLKKYVFKYSKKIKGHNVVLLVLPMKLCAFLLVLHFYARKICPILKRCRPFARQKVGTKRDLQTISRNGPRKGENIHLGCLAFHKGPGAFVYSRTGGKNIVDQENLFISNLFRLAHQKNISDISAPFSSAKPCLGFGPKMSFQNCGGYHVFPGGKYFSGKYKGLVKTPLAQTSCMEGYRHKQIRLWLRLVL